MDEETSVKKSYLGACLTILALITTFLFFFAKTQSLHNRYDVDILTSTAENAVSVDDKFDTSRGFYVTAALTYYDSETEVLEDPDKYGELVAEHFQWGNGFGDDALAWSSDEVDLDYCTDAQLGLTPDNSTILYPTIENNKKEV